MKVGIMTNHFVRQSLDETLDAIISHDIFHVQFNLFKTYLRGQWKILLTRIWAKD